MQANGDKVLELPQAIGKFVKQGDHMSLGGFTLNRSPMAAIHELIRQGIGNLHLYVHSQGVALEEMIGSGLVSGLEVAYGGVGKTTPTGHRFRKAIQNNLINFEDYSNFHMTLRFIAGSWGVPYLPTRSGLGSDLLEKWGFPKDMREADPKLPDLKLVVQDNPFGGWGDASRLVLVPAITPDVTIIHVQKADCSGNCRIDGLTFADLEQAKASQNVIVTCEELVDSDELRQEPERNQLAMFHVSAVCPVPYGAYPTAAYRHYDYDPQFLKEHDWAARDDERYREYQEEYIFGVSNHQEFLEKVGLDRLETIKADPRTGYAVNLKRD